MPVRHFIRSFFQIAGGKIVVSLGLLLVVGVIQGVGLLLILPFLNLIGIGGETSPAALPSAVNWLVETGEKMGFSWTLTSVLAAFVCAVALSSLLRFWQAVHSSNLIRTITREFQNRFYRRWLIRPWIESSRYSGGEILNFIQRDIGQLSLFLSQALMLCSASIFAVVYSVVALQVSTVITAIALGSGIIMFFLLIPLRRYAFLLSSELRGRFKEQYDLISEHLNSLKLIKAFAREPHELAFLTNSTAALQTQSHRISVAHALAALFQGVMGGAMLAVIVYLAVSRYAINAASLIVLVFLFSRLLPQLINIQTVWQRILTTMPSVNAIAGYETDIELEVSLTDHRDPVSLNSGLSIEALGFSWAGKSDPVFDRFSATIPSKKITVITGDSGAGKSTLCQLILGLIEPDRGKILLDGNALPVFWNHSIGYVPQDDFLFSQSIKENLLWGNLDATEVELWSALESAAALEFVKKLPEGLDTVVSEKGESLSGGERQRIAIARAIIRKPSLLILDEPTSALDSQNEATLREVLKRQAEERTIVLISHRSFLLEIADHIIDLSSDK